MNNIENQSLGSKWEETLGIKSKPNGKYVQNKLYGINIQNQ